MDIDLYRCFIEMWYLAICFVGFGCIKMFLVVGHWSLVRML